MKKENNKINDLQSYSNGIQIFYRTIGIVTLIAFIIFGTFIFLLKNS